MKLTQIATTGALALLATTAACVPKAAPPPPVAAPAPVRPPAPPSPAPAPVHANWLDAPQTPGDWSYRAGAGGGIAAFGVGGGAAPLFTMRCDLAARSVILGRGATSPTTAAAGMTVRTETQTRTLPATRSQSATDPGGAVQARVTRDDRLLDAMALSKGRFAVEVPGMNSLYLPSWAEVTRVIEDCR